MKPYLLLILLVLYQLAGCQPAKDNKQPQEFSCPTEGFCIQDSLLFYNGKKIELSLDINSLVPVLGNYNRVIEDLTKNYVKTRWYWKDNKHYAHYSSTDSLITFIPNPNGIGTEKYKTIEQITTKYGKYDSVKIENIKLERMDNRFYSWDRLGIQATSTNDTLNSIYLYMNTEEKRSHKYTPRQPQGKYTGKLTINGITLNLAERKTNTWSKDMKALGISSKEYSLPGDSKDWYRVKETPYFIVIFERNDDIVDKLIQPQLKIPDYIKKVRITYK